MARMNRPAPVEVSYKNMRFLITHNPTNATLSSFIEDLKKYGATTVVRVCEVTYDKAPLEKDGITVVRGLAQPRRQEAAHTWAPVLVALALIESGMKYEDAIQFIRQKRRGAINSKQLTYLEKYRPKQRLRFKDPHTHKTKCCVM
ncbi:protein tyrosine phosphatase type IVA 3 [Carlito syrichta]|uniref:Protein tyrosine phosphatase type IVA 3 n=1 Tax=Carlito syrichta TaxID=1868482 RepID=A0A3Q0DIG8_CARSF|nr:protein tyrosine phosphatase type IVA 3 [Carlito syrichta]